MNVQSSAKMRGWSDIIHHMLLSRECRNVGRLHRALIEHNVKENKEESLHKHL